MSRVPQPHCTQQTSSGALIARLEPKNEGSKGDSCSATVSTLSNDPYRRAPLTPRFVGVAGLPVLGCFHESVVQQLHSGRGGLIGVWAEKEACAGQRGENLVTVSSRVAYLAKELVEKVSYGLKGPGRTAPLATSTQILGKLMMAGR